MTEEKQKEVVIDVGRSITDLNDAVQVLTRRADAQQEEAEAAFKDIGGLSARMDVFNDLVIEGIIYANQGSSEWCIMYLKRAIDAGCITRDFARHLLFNVIRVDGYWRARFEQVVPEG
ncbi:MAG: hypothetical protein GWN58_49855 [Anaerolineae bacterium]|nr:hypothetical protein [Anaerolineae bacterium]